MIGFALPWLLGVAVAGILGISALHLLSVRRPPELVLPTARFLPVRDVRAVSRTRKPSDVLLLAVRIAALLAAGLAAAMPIWKTRARQRVVMVVADPGVKQDTVAMRALVQEAGGSLRVVFVADDTANARGSENAAALMPMAWRAASQLSQQDASVDSIDLHILLSTGPTRDAGLVAWRAAWPGRVVTHYSAGVDVPRRVVVVSGGQRNGRSATSGASGGGAGDVARGSRADDAVQAAFAWHVARVSHAGAARVDTVKLSRGDGSSDMDEALSASRVLVTWPESGVPATWRATAGAKGGSADSAAALALGGRALIGPFPVNAVLPDDIIAKAKSDTAVRPIAWWSDGRVAATERRMTNRCERIVAVTSDPASDILLSSSANALFDRLLAPCEARALVDASALSVTDMKAGPLAAAERFRGTSGAPGARTSFIVPMLFALSLMLLALEWRLRTRALAGAA